MAPASASLPSEGFVAAKRKLQPQDGKALEDLFVDVIAPTSEERRVIGRPFQPGQSGNPSGKAAEADGLDANLRLVIGKAGARKLAKTLYDMGIGADGSSGHVKLSALQYIFDRLEGRPRPTQRDEQEVEDPLVVILRGLVNDRSALEGRPLPAQLGPVVEGEVREYPSEDAGA